MTRLQQEMQRMADDNSRIEELEAEVERLVNGWKDEAMAKDAEIALLRSALKPFADLARTYKVETGEFNRPDDKPVFGLNDAKITVGDLRAALKALEET